MEILENYFSTYHIRDATEIKGEEVHHFNQWKQEMKQTRGWLPLEQGRVDIAITSGASCPDVLVDEVVLKILTFSRIPTHSMM